jgi:hypothetical protein
MSAKLILAMYSEHQSNGHFAALADFNVAVPDLTTYRSCERSSSVIPRQDVTLVLEPTKSPSNSEQNMWRAR